MLVLNKDIHEFDKKENKERKLHKPKEWIHRIIYLIDAKLFEDTYKDEWEKMNSEIDKLKRENFKLDKKNKKLLKKEVIDDEKEA